MPNNVIVNNDELGADILWSGIWGNSNLIPAGTFPNIPNYTQYSATKDSTNQLTLTLQQVKDSLKLQLAQTQGVDAEAESTDMLAEQFLVDFITLLVDYRDLRNYVFYGSAYTELSYNINYIVQNFPYKYLISTLTSSLGSDAAEFSVTNNLSTNQTIILLNQSAIKDCIEEFNFYDNNINFDWTQYDLTDSNNVRYPVIAIETPYTSTTIFDITAISSVSVTPPTPYMSYNTLQITTDTPHNYLAGQSINIFENTLLNTMTNVADLSLNDNYIVSQVIDSTNFLIVSKYAITQILSGNPDLFSQAVSIPAGYTVQDNGIVRLIPLSANPQPYSVKIVVSGNFTQTQFLNYLDANNISYSGFMLSPKQITLSNWEYKQTPIQRMLLSPAPINPTPWPRRNVTQNIEHLITASAYNPAEPDFVSWIKSPTNSYVPDNTDNDNDLAYSDPYTEYNLVRALALDETETNQILRRCIPADLISELNDTPNALFQRFILIAGWMFDQIKIYIKFIKYVHHVDYSNFNALSPEYYKYYADYYGFTLFDDDSVDFSKLVLQTEPGFYFIPAGDTTQGNNPYYQLSLQKLLYERQKRLLTSLFFLYKSKGTPGVVKKLVAILGAPDNFLVFNEYKFQINNTDQFDYYSTSGLVGKAVVDNQKIYTPDFHFEADPNYPLPVNSQMPPVYRMRLHNESEINMRTVAINTNPNGAVDSQIVNIFGNQTYNYGKFQNGEFATLQKLNDDFTLDNPYHVLPLTIPDKFRSITVEYMIPRAGYIKGTGNNLDEVSIHLCSLYEISNEPVPQLINNVYAYTLPENFSNFDYDSIRTTSSDTIPRNDGLPNPQSDFSILNRYFTGSSNVSIINPYVIVRLEGNDLVVRIRIENETLQPTGDIGERVAILPNIFTADGLNHTLKIQFRAEGIEVYEDFAHVGLITNNKLGIAYWQDPTTSSDGVPYCAFEIPKAKISALQYLPYDDSIFVATPTNTAPDNVHYWDMLIGMPSNIDFYFKRIEISENYAIDSFDIGDKITNTLNYTSEYYSFDFSNNDNDDNTSFLIRSQFSQLEPNIANADYNYILPTESFTNSAGADLIVIKDLSLSPKTLLLDSSGNPISTQKYFANRKQDFFLVKDVFAENAFEKNLHQQYYYPFYDKVIKLYQLYSSQVLTYDLLQNFLNLIENNFKATIQSFIPIVINISQFGRLIANSQFNQAKVRYSNIQKFCVGTTIGVNGLVQGRIYDASTNIKQGNNLLVSLKNSDSTNLIPPFTVIWQGTVQTTLGKLIVDLQDATINPYASKIVPSLDGSLFRMAINSNWYFTTTGLDVNEVVFSVNDGITTYSLTFSHGTQNTLSTSCGSIEYRLPNVETSDVFIFYDSEHQAPTYVHYGSENNNEKVYINY